MGNKVVAGAALTCSCGAAPATLNVLPVNGHNTSSSATATVEDNKPMVNIPPFGMCNSQANPMVIAATAAAMGTPTPAPCMPNIVSPWTPGNPGIKINGCAALTDDSTCQCAWAGSISISDAGQQGVSTS